MRTPGIRPLRSEVSRLGDRRRAVPARRCTVTRSTRRPAFRAASMPAATWSTSIGSSAIPSSPAPFSRRNASACPSLRGPPGEPEQRDVPARRRTAATARRPPRPTGRPARRNSPGDVAPGARPAAHRRALRTRERSRLPAVTLPPPRSAIMPMATRSWLSRISSASRVVQLLPCASRSASAATLCVTAAIPSGFSAIARQPRRAACGVVEIFLGHGRENPSLGHLRVASMPILLP